MKYPKETKCVGEFSPYDFDDLNFEEIREYLQKLTDEYQHLYPGYELTLDFSGGSHYDSETFEIYAKKYYDSKEDYEENRKKQIEESVEKTRQTELKQLEMLKQKYEN